MPHRQFLPPAMVTVPIERNGCHVALHARITTPGNPLATAVDPTLPTMLFCHPTWLDSFFFYPQTEDPLFDGHNLIAFDMRGHGLTSVEGVDDKYDMWGVADDIKEGLTALGINKAHVVGVALGSMVAAALASRYPDTVQSLILVSVPPPYDTPEMAVGYADCQDAYIAAATTGDAELLDAITTATFEYDAGNISPIIREIRDEYMSLARQRLKAPNAAATAKDMAFYIWNPVTRREPLTAAEISKITAPTLILQGCGALDDHTQDAQDFAALFNCIQAGETSGARATLRLVSNVGHYMTLTSPNVVNPLIAKFINTPNSGGLPALPKAGQRIIGPAVARRPSTPRSTKFDIPPIPRVIPGMRTIGDELDILSVDVEVVSNII